MLLSVQPRSWLLVFRETDVNHPVVASRGAFHKAIKSGAKRIEIRPPEGKSVDEFIPRLVTYAKRLPEFEGFDVYEVDAAIRHMAFGRVDILNLRR
jgi:hypothetical protein